MTSHSTHVSPTGEQLYMMVTSRFKSGSFPWAMVAESGKEAWCAAASDLLLSPDTILARYSQPERAAAELPAHPDDLMVDALAAAMKAKMAKQRANGYGGWDDETVCPADRLRTMLRDHVQKGDPVDVANFAGMLLARGESTAAAEVPGEEQAAFREYDARVNAKNQTGSPIWRDAVERTRAALAQREATKHGIAKDAERYRKLRRGQKWSVIDGIGRELKGDDLDAAVDAAPNMIAAIAQQTAARERVE